MAQNEALARIQDCQRRRDWVSLAKVYYELGVSAMDGGDLYQAQLWLQRADTVYSAADETYDEVGKDLVDDCSDRIGRLEDEEDLLYNAVPTEVDQAAERLSGPQVQVWGLLSIARLVKLGERLAALPGCEVLGELGWAVDVMLDSFQRLPSVEDYQRLMDICGRLYRLEEAEAVFGGGEIEVPGGAPFQVFDLNGMMGVHTEINGYIDNHLSLLSALSQGAEDLPAPGSEMVGCTLLPDYYVRTLGGDPAEVPQVQRELARIWSDYEFVRAGVTWEQVGQRVAAYKELDILQA